MTANRADLREVFIRVATKHVGGDCAAAIAAALDEAEQEVRALAAPDRADLPAEFYHGHDSYYEGCEECENARLAAPDRADTWIAEHDKRYGLATPDRADRCTCGYSSLTHADWCVLATPDRADPTETPTGRWFRETYGRNGEYRVAVMRDRVATWCICYRKLDDA